MAQKQDKKTGVFADSKTAEKWADSIEGQFRITIPEKPFSGGPIKWTDKNVSPGQGYRELLTANELLLLGRILPEMSSIGLEAVLRRDFHIGDERIKTLTWTEISVFCIYSMEIFVWIIPSIQN